MSPEPSPDLNRLAPPPAGLPETVDVTAAPTGDHIPEAEAVPEAPPGAPVIPGYAIHALIARGGMGAVYSARDLTLDREVAIKTLLPGADPARFVTEAKVTARLPHPGIPPVHALGTLADGGHFLAMKLIRGDTLARLLKDRPSPAADLPRFVQVFEQIAQAVGFAHSRGVIHRDLKPLNVMVGEFGEVQVMDWGLAKGHAAADAATDGGIASDDAEHTRAGSIMGTPGYMAPEQARGEPVDTRADVFALGAVLAAILTGKPAFVGTTARETIDKAAAADLADVLARLDACDADAELIDLADWCLSADAADRPADARTVAAEVGAYRAGVEARLRQAETDRAKAETQAAEQRKRRRLVQWAACAVAVVLLLGIAGTAVGLVRAADARDREKERADGERLEKEEKERQRALAVKREAEAVEARNKEAKARLEEERAKERTADVLDAMVSEVTGESLATQKVISDEQKTFLKQVLPYYQEFAAGRGSDEKSRARVAQAAFRLGTIEYRLGRRLEGLAAFQIARDGYEALATEFLANSEYRPKLAASHTNLGMMLAELGKRAEAEEQYRKALAIQLAPATELRAPGYRRDLAASHTNLGNLLADLGQPAEAAEQFRKALDVLEKLAAEFPDPDCRHDLAQVHFNLGTLLIELGKRAEADAQYRKALDVQEQLAAEFPTPEYRNTLAKIRFNQGNLRADLGKLAEAEELIRKALAIQEKLAAEFPVAPGYRHDLALSHTNLGILQGRLWKWAEAEEQLRKALALQEKMVAEFPATPRYRRDLAQVHINLGVLLSKTGKQKEADGQYRKALGIQQKLVAEFPTADEYRHALAMSHYSLGALYMNQQNWEEAIVQARSAIKADPTLAITHAMLGAALQKTGDIAGARAALTEAVRLDPKSPQWKALLAKLPPPLPVAPPPRERK